MGGILGPSRDHMIRIFRLTNEPGGMGLSCTRAGLSLAGVSLLRKTEAGFAPRSSPEIALLIKAAYGADAASTRLHSSLGVIAEALNRGDLVRASIAAVQTRTPELSWEAAARLANVDLRLSKYDPKEPRDWRGRWTSGDAAAPARAAASAGDSAAHQEVKPAAPQVSNPGQRGDGRNPLAMPTAFDSSNDAAGEDDARDDSPDPTSPTYEFERKYDDLGPVEFAKQAIEFGDWLGRNGANLPPADKERALAEYSFLQDRLNFWQAYDYTPPKAQLNLHSAALTLFQGASNSGLVRPGDLPPSMLDVAGVAALGTDAAPPNMRPATTKPDFELPRPAPEEVYREIKGLGGVVENSEVGIEWNNGINQQGGPFQRYVGKENPDAAEMPANSKTFDQLNETTGEALSDKTLNTLSVSYIKSPQKILRRLKRYVDAAADYEPRTGQDADPEIIRSKTIHLGIPEYTSPTQWQYLNLGSRYAREHDVSLIITRIRQ